MITTILVILGVILLTAAYKRRNSTITQSGLSGVNLFEDFLNGTNGTAYTTSLANSGNITQGQLTNRSTCVEFTNSVTTDVATMKTGSYTFVMTTGEVLSIATDHCLFGSGTAFTRFLFGTLNITAPVDIFQAGAFFMADFSVSNNWICVRTDSNGVSSTTVTTVPVDLTAGGGLTGSFHRLKIISTNSRSLFYYDAVLVASIANTWVDDTIMNTVVDLRTSGGAASISRAYLDYVQTIFQLSAPRPTP